MPRNLTLSHCLNINLENEEGWMKYEFLEETPTCDEVMIHAWLGDQKRPEDLKWITITDISIDAMTEPFAKYRGLA